MYADKILHCRDCDETFTFTAGEQEFFASKKFGNEPTRCQPCRQRRKAESSGGRAGFRAQPQRQTFSVICADCAQETQVPFEPSLDGKSRVAVVRGNRALSLLAENISIRQSL